MIVGPSTALDLLPALPWELLPSPYSPAELLTGRELNTHRRRRRVHAGARLARASADGSASSLAGGTPHLAEGAGVLQRLTTWPWRFRFTRGWMMRSADVIVGVSRAQQRSFSATAPPTSRSSPCTPRTPRASRRTPGGSPPRNSTM